MNPDQQTYIHRRGGRFATALFPCILLSILAAGMAQAQSTAIVSGLVQANGSALPGVNIVLTNEATSAEHATFSNDAGEYNFQAIPQGTYTLRASQQPFQTYEQRNIAIGAQPSLTLDIAMTIGSLQESVVVTAGGFEQKVTNAPASISVVTQDDLKIKQFDNLAEALIGIEGVDINQATGKTGGLEVSIRGMPSAYTLLMIDGRRQNTSGDVTPNGFSETQNNYIPPLSAVERIEVIRGPMSSLYGSDAVGGVVNIITRRTPEKWTGSADLDNLVQQHGDYGASRVGNFYAAGPVIRNLLGVAVRGRALARGPSSLKFADGTNVSRRGVAPVEGRNTNWGTRLTLTPHVNHAISFDFERGRQRYNNDNCQLGTLDGWSGTEYAGCLSASTQAGGYRDELNFNRDQMALSHRSNLSFGLWESALTYRKTETIGRTVPGTLGIAWVGFPGIVGGEPRKLKSDDLILDSKVILPVHRSHTLIVGGQYIDAEVKDGLATDAFKQRSLAVFGEDQWNIRRNLTLTFGGRYENHSAFGGHLTPRGYLTWAPGDRWTLKGGVGRGYRAPTVNQLHDGINGVILQGTFLTIGSPHLKPETSTNYEVGLYFNNLAGFNANVTLFRTNFNNMIGVGIPIANCASATAPNQPGCLDLGSGFTQDNFAQGTNVDSARSHGAELAVNWRFARRWTINSNYTYATTLQKSGVDHGAPITTQPPHIVNATLNWQTTEKLRLWLRGEYYGSRPRFPNRPENLTAPDRAILNGLGRLKAYEQFHLGASYQVNRMVTLNGTVYNLLDKDFLACGIYTTNTGANVCGSRYFQLGRVPAGHTTFFGTSQEKRRFWMSVNIRF